MILESIVGGIILGGGMSVYNFLNKKKKGEGKTEEEWEEFLNEIQITNKAGKGLTYDSKNSKDNFVLFHCPYGINENDIKNKEDYFKIFLDVTRLEYSVKGKWLEMYFYKETLPELVLFEKVEPKDDTFEIFIGKTVNNYCKIDFYKIPHVLIAGMTGSGKSSTLHGMMIQMCNHKQEPLLYLADLKGLELLRYRNHKNVLEYTDTLEDTERIIYELVEEYERRKELFKKHPKEPESIEEYNKLVSDDKKLKPIVLVVEECVRLMLSKAKGGKNPQPSISEVLSTLLFLSRATGIFAVLTIQRPTASCLSPEIKSSLGNIIGLKTSNALNSRVICDDSKLKDLRGNGHGWLFNELGEVEFQGFYVKPIDVKKYLN